MYRLSWVRVNAKNSRGTPLKNVKAYNFERVGHTVTQLSVDARIKKFLESKDYPSLKRECEAYAERLKKARGETPGDHSSQNCRASGE